MNHRERLTGKFIDNKASQGMMSELEGSIALSGKVTGEDRGIEITSLMAEESLADGSYLGHSVLYTAWGMLRDPYLSDPHLRGL